MLYEVITRLGDTSPALSYAPEAGCFQFEAGSEQAGLRFSALLPRATTYELLKNFGKLGDEFRQLPDGRPGSNVSMTAGGDLVIKPIVRLADGRVMYVSELRHHKFGNHYYLHGGGSYNFV